MGVRDLLFIGLVLGGAAGLGASLYPPRLDAKKQAASPRPGRDRDDGLNEAVKRVDAAFRARWSSQGLTPAPPASELALVRRVALGLTGSIPSLEELRRLESVPEGRKTAWYV